MRRRCLRRYPRPGLDSLTVRNRDLIIVAAGVLALVLAISLWHVRRDPKLSADATAAALQQELHTAYGFRCRPKENDGTITGLGDVDYLCEAERVSEPGYWVATDGSKITGRQSMG
jgi:hypothetical protein